MKRATPTGLNFYDQDFGSLPKEQQPRHQLEIEMGMFARNADDPRGVGLGKAEHFKNITKMVLPWVSQHWHDWNELCLWAWCNYEEVAMSGCAAAHKTFTFSLLADFEFFCSPHNTAVILTSSTVPSLRTRLWPRIKEFFQRCYFPDGSVIPWPYNLVDSKTTIQFQKGDDEHAIRAVAVDSGSIEKAIGKIIGAHPGRVIVVVDEAAQTQPAIFSARSNLAVGTSFYRFAAIANAVSPFDAHGTFCEPKKGWSSVSVNDEYWETKTGICLHFDGFKSPNVILGQERYPKLFSQRNIEDTRAKFGENSLEWWKDVRGFWAPSGVCNTVLDASTIADGRAKDKAVWESLFTPIGSNDPAFTTGGDACILRFAKVGKFVDGPFGMDLWDVIHVQLDASGKVPINYQIADRIKTECEARGVQPQNFEMDTTSNTGLADILSQRWSPLIRRCSFGGAASDRPVSDVDPKKSCDVYGNKVAELWFSFARLVRAGKVRGLDNETAGEFCSRLYELRGEKHYVETKAEMKKRTNGKSPDRADAAVMLSNIARDLDSSRTEVPANMTPEIDFQTIAKRHANIHARGYRAA